MQFYRKLEVYLKETNQPYPIRKLDAFFYILAIGISIYAIYHPKDPQIFGVLLNTYTIWLSFSIIINSLTYLKLPSLLKEDYNNDHTTAKFYWRILKSVAGLYTTQGKINFAINKLIYIIAFGMMNIVLFNHNDTNNMICLSLLVIWNNLMKVNIIILLKQLFEKNANAIKIADPEFYTNLKP